MDRRPRLLAVAVFACLVMLMVGLPGPAQARQTPALPRGAGLHREALLVRYVPGTSHEALKSVAAAAGASEVGLIEQIDTTVLSVSPGHERAAVIRALRTSPAVVSIESDAKAHVTLTPNDPFWPEEWFARRVRVNRAWDTSTGNHGPVVAVLDTGVQRSQPDLSGRVLSGHDFVNGDGGAFDDMGHGTQVAGIVDAIGMNDIGIAGMCWRCRILPVKVADKKGDVSWSNAAAGLVWATDHGARVANMSFGRNTGNATIAAAVNYAQRHGVLLVASAGNEGNYAKFYPAAYPGVLSVAASNQDDNLYSWSTRGDWVRIAAPGCAWTTQRNEKWGEFCGTSASSPIVAGAAALLLAVRPHTTRRDLIAALVSSSAQVVPAIGGGRLNVNAALSALLSGG